MGLGKSADAPTRTASEHEQSHPEGRSRSYKTHEERTLVFPFFVGENSGRDSLISANRICCIIVEKHNFNKPFSKKKKKRKGKNSPLCL